MICSTGPCVYYCNTLMPVLPDTALSFVYYWLVVCFLSFSDKCFASGCKPSGVWRVQWHYASGAWQDQPPAGGLPGPPHKVTYIHLQKSVISLNSVYEIIDMCLYCVMQTVHQVTAKGSCHSTVLRETWEMEPGMVHDGGSYTNCLISLLMSRMLFCEHILAMCVLNCLCVEPAGGSCSEDGYCWAWR